MSNVLDLPKLRHPRVENRPMYGVRRAIAAGIALVSMGVVADITTTQEQVCATALPAPNAWTSGSQLTHELQSKGVYIPDQRAVTELVSTPAGGEEICGTIYVGVPGLAGLDALIKGGANIHTQP